MRGLTYPLVKILRNSTVADVSWPKDTRELKRNIAMCGTVDSKIIMLEYAPEFGFIGIICCSSYY